MEKNPQKKIIVLFRFSDQITFIKMKTFSIIHSVCRGLVAKVVMFRTPPGKKQEIELILMRDP